MLRRILFIFLLIGLTAGGALAQTDAQLKSKFERKLTQLVAQLDGVAGVAVKDLRTGEEFVINGDEVFPQASVIKIPVLVTFFEKVHRGQLKLGEMVRIKPEWVVGGSGIIQQLDDGRARFSNYDLAVLMITLSDNTATNVLIDRVGMASVNELMQKLGLSHTLLQRKMMDTEAGKAGRENLSTPVEMMRLMEILSKSELLSRDVCTGTLRILRKPKRGNIQKGLPDGVPLANKTGGLLRIVNEVALVEYPQNPYILSVMTKLLKDEDEGARFIQEVSRTCFSYFRRMGTANEFGRSFMDSLPRR